VGRWTTEATHPAFPGTTVSGSAEIEWLEGERSLLFRARNEHPDFPDSISILGDTDGPKWHYFDSRGVHRVYELGITSDAWEISREMPAEDDAFSQRLTVTFGDGDGSMDGRSAISHDNETWQDDLQITYRRSG
jgi:hypothetical protein